MKNLDGTWFYSKNKITGKLGMVAALDTIFNTLFIFFRRSTSIPVLNYIELGIHITAIVLMMVLVYKDMTAKATERERLFPVILLAAAYCITINLYHTFNRIIYN